MKKTLLLSCMLGAVGGFAEAAEPLVSSSVRAEVKDAIPGAAPKPNKTIYYADPGKINIKAAQWCGDSDVEHYAQSHPTWVNKITTKMPFVLGYWIAPEGDALGYVPTASSFVALGTGIVPVGQGYISSFVPANQSYNGSSDDSKKKEMYPYALQAIRSLASAKSFAMKDGQGQKYRMFLGAMMCHDGGDIEKIPVKDQGRYGIAPAELTANLAGSVYGAIVTAATVNKAKTWDKIEKAMEFGLDLKTNNDQNSGGVKFDDKESEVRLRGPLAKIAERVRDFDFDFTKTYTPNLADALKDELKDKSFSKALKQLADSLDSSERCSDVKNSVDELKNEAWDPAKYAWEPYPIQLTCRALNGGTAGNFGKAVDAFLNPSSNDKAAYETKRSEVIRLLVQGAQMQNAQFYVHNQIKDEKKGWEIPKQRCFNDASPMINYTMQSLVIQVPETAAANYGTSHPEPDFAIGGSGPYMSADQPKYKRENTDAKYTTDGFDNFATNDPHTVFGMSGVKPEDVSLVLQQGNLIDNSGTKYMPGTMQLNFNVRGIGSCLPQYCNNGKLPYAPASRI
ncbi:MAG: hypothetical protein EOP11_03840 [Proteobacteria bacterium]|nr:MAG: hypothetical protein EOP11_03840 [Pseudomonadota bacterium]